MTCQRRIPNEDWWLKAMPGAGKSKTHKAFVPVLKGPRCDRERIAEDLRKRIHAVMTPDWVGAWQVAEALGEKTERIRNNMVILVREGLIENKKVSNRIYFRRAV
jgi:hypothetical protein